MIFIILFVYSFAPLPGTGLITRVGSPLVRNDSCPNRGGAMLIAAYAPFSSRLLPLRDATQCLFNLFPGPFKRGLGLHHRGPHRIELHAPCRRQKVSRPRLPR
jgi:hypothetical protein